MENLIQLIDALSNIQDQFNERNKGRAFLGIVLTIAQVFPEYADLYKDLLPAPQTRSIRQPVKLKSSPSTSNNSGCVTCGKNKNVPRVSTTTILKLEKNVVSGQSIEEEGQGISPVTFENPENILTGEPIIENEWKSLLLNVPDIKAAKEMYKAVTGKNYSNKLPQELDQIVKAIWDAKSSLEI